MRAFRRILSGLPLHAVVIGITLLWMLPSVGLFISSFRTPREITSSGWWTVFMTPFDFTQWTLDNYARVIASEGLGQAFRNSLLIAIPGTVLPIVIASFAAFALAWMEFKGRQFLFSLIVGLIVVPLQMTFIPVYTPVSYTHLAPVWHAGAERGRPVGHVQRHTGGSLAHGLAGLG